MNKKVIVVGAGLGGLAAAIRLAGAGHSVEIWEKNAGAGGKLQECQRNGFRWDMGPSLLTMPQVLRDLFSAVGRRLEDYLELRRLDSACRYFWTDGTVLDEDEAFWRQPEAARFLEYARGIYELSGEAYLNHPPDGWWRAFQWNRLSQLRHLPKVATGRTLAQKAEEFFPDRYRRQLFQRFATYNGSSPFRTPATFNIIPYVEQHFGAWYVQGGLVQVGRALERLARECGVVFHYQTEVAGWRDGRLESADGRTARPGYLVCNGDVIQAANTWLGEAFPAAGPAKLARPALSSSGYVLFLGVKHRYEQLRHHNIFFSDDYESEFRDIFERRRLPEDPTVYVSITARSDAGDAPAGQDNYFVLINAPAVAPGEIPAGDWEQYRAVVIRKLERSGLAGLGGEIVCEQVFTPEDFSRRDRAWKGALYGWASHSIRTSLFRPPLRSRNDPRVFFAGGTTHPGGGIPLVLLSGKMVAEQILKDRG